MFLGQRMRGETGTEWRENSWISSKLPFLGFLTDFVHAFFGQICSITLVVFSHDLNCFECVLCNVYEYVPVPIWTHEQVVPSVLHRSCLSLWRGTRWTWPTRGERSSSKMSLTGSPSHSQPEGNLSYYLWIFYLISSTLKKPLTFAVKQQIHKKKRKPEVWFFENHLTLILWTTPNRQHCLQGRSY